MGKQKINRQTRSKNRKGKLSMGEQLLIAVLYTLEGFKNFKYYYKYVVEIKIQKFIKALPCYDRFIQITPKLLVLLSILL